MKILHHRLRFSAKLSKALGIGGLLFCSYALASAQSAETSSPSISLAQQKASIMTPAKDEQRGDMPANVEAEMRVKRAIKLEEKEYKENVDRARDLSVLAESVNAAYKEKTYLSRDEIKKIERAEKLAKSIRNAAGGSEDDADMEQPPTDLACALTTFAETTESLKKNVEKTPKHVISAAVIDGANVVLELARIIRRLIPNP